MDSLDKEQYGFGSFPVSVIPHFYVELNDGNKLAIKVWFPSHTLVGSCFEGTPSDILCRGSGEIGGGVPCIMEYIPYRKSDVMAMRDHRRHAWFCSHGYVSVRVDMRGSGDSTGVYFDEYLKQEQDDAAEIIAWFSRQNWCNGSVGMMGKSWGGFNGLQVAFCQPSALKAVISAYSTDDRYTDDIHYMGGCVVGNGMALWGSFMAVINALPPSPIYVKNWKTEWLKRLKTASKPWTYAWLSHPLRDNYWKHGSVCEDYGRVQIPVLAIGGLVDAYTNSVPRLADNLPNGKAIIGPWAHGFPDDASSYPGPVVDYLRECLEWWDYHLKGIQNGTEDAPKYRLYVLDGHESTPTPTSYSRNGKWLSMSALPTRKSIVLDNVSGKLLFNNDTKIDQLSKCTEIVASWESTVLSSGDWFCSGPHEQLPSDQGEADALSLCWKTPALDNDLVILGAPIVRLTVAVEGDTSALVAARLCDVHPDGQSTLISYGLLNLTHHRGHDEDEVSPLEEGKDYNVTINMKVAGYTVPRGHKLLLGVSPSYWPIAWPSPKKTKLHISTGSTDGPALGFMELPILDDINSGTSSHLKNLISPPNKVCNMQHTILRQSSYQRTSKKIEPHGLSIRVTEDSGRNVLQDGTICDQVMHDQYDIMPNNPLSARAKHDYTSKLEWPMKESEAITVEVNAKHEMWCDEDHFYLKCSLQAIEGQQLIHKEEWNDKIKRFCV